MLNVILMHSAELAPSGCENYVLVCDVGKGKSERYCLDLARISGKGMGVGKAVRKCRLVRVSNKDWMGRTQGGSWKFCGEYMRWPAEFESIPINHFESVPPISAAPLLIVHYSGGLPLWWLFPEQMTFHGLSQPGVQVLPLPYLWITSPESQRADKIPHHFPEGQINGGFLHSVLWHPSSPGEANTIWLFSPVASAFFRDWDSVNCFYGVQFISFPQLSEKPSIFFYHIPPPADSCLSVGSNHSASSTFLSQLLSTWQQHCFLLPPHWVTFTVT